jgi:CBS domain-containing protein
MRIDRLLTREPVCIAEAATPAEAAALMRASHVGILLVVEGKGEVHPSGMVTDRDLAINALAGNAATVREAMTPVVATVGIGADSHEALELMAAHGVRRLLVTGRNGEPVGVLSIDDLVDGLAAELRAAAAVLKHEIRRDSAGLGTVRV